MNATLRAAALYLCATTVALTLSSCKKEEAQTIDEPAVRELRILEPFPDRSEPDPFSRPRPDLHDILTRVWDATANENVKGLFLRVGGLKGSWGSVMDLTEALDQFRSETRPIHCHFEATDNVGYLFMASVCDRISMSPAGTLDLIGPSAVMLYARSFLEKLGIEAQIIHMGRYKGAGDTLIRDDMPLEAKESMDAILDGLYGSLVAATALRTDGDEARARAVIDDGPYTSEAAETAKLVDGVQYLREAREEAKKASGVDTIRRTRMVPKQDPLTLGQFLDLLSGDSDEPKLEDARVALVFVTGNIVDGEAPMPGEAVSGPFVRAMERLEEDDEVKAVVLRVNSPGGSALASDRMWQAVRNLAEHKPVIASIGNVAASGGYYIASAADDILAHPNSLVGSIGVVGGKLNLGPLSDEAGVHAFVLQRGERAAWATPARGLNETEREAFKELLQSTYDRFIDRVAVGREMEREAVLAAAEGRVMTAAAGQPLGLIDEMAGLGEALQRARKAGGLDADSPLEIWPASKGVIDMINQLFGGGGDDARKVQRMLLRAHPLAASLPVEPWFDAFRIVATERVALVPPYLWSIR